jgi:hypothetical protein
MGNCHTVGPNEVLVISGKWNVFLALSNMHPENRILIKRVRSKA